MAQTIADLEIKISSQSSNASENIDKLARSLEGLKNNAKLTTVKNNLNKLSESLNNLQSSSSSLSNLNKLSKSLNNISSSFKGINSAKAVQGITSYNSVAQKATASNKNFGTSLAWVATKATLMYQGITRAFSALGQFVKLSNDYIENMNIFTVAMGGMYDEAFAYAQLVNEKLGIDISEWTRNQAVFASMANGFGLAEEQVYKLSKGLTEVSYDLASLYNADTQTAFTKVRSALAGEIEPLRQWGFALDQNTLQQVANAHGIQMQYSAMTQSQKAMLRYTAIVEQATKMGAIGDMARTLESPANAIRILQQQFVQLGRAIGNVFLPILQQVIPYVQAFTRVLTTLISKLATLVGFTMPTWDNSSWEGTSGAIDEATESAKEYKNATMGFDELNTISEPSSSASGGLGGDLGLNIEDVWTEGMLAGITSEVDTLVSKIETLFAKLTQPLEVISFDNLKLALTNLGIALAPFAENVGAGLWWLYTEVLVPLAEWTIEDALPTFINAIATGITNLQVGLDNFGSWLSNNIEPIIGIGVALGTFFGLWALGAVVVGSAGAITGALTTFGTALSILWGVLTGNSAAMSALAFTFPQVTGAINFILAPLTALGGLFGATGATATALGFAVLGGIAVVVGAFAQLYASSEEFRNKVNELVSLIADTFITVFKDLWDIVISVKDVFVGFLEHAIKPVWNFIVSFLEPIFNILIDVLTWLWKYVIDPLATTISGVLSDAFKSVSKLLVDKVFPAFEGIIEIITWLWEKIFKPFIDWLWNIFKPLFENLFSAVKQVIERFGEAVSKVIDGACKVIGGLIDFITGVFTGDWDKAWQGVCDIFGGIWDIITGAFDGIVGNFFEFGKNIIKGIIDGIGSLLSSLWDTVTNVVNKVKSAVSKIFSAKKEAESISVSSTVTQGTIETYATGGVVSTGQMFIAREAGAELVGNIGGRTSVMNNDQIVQAVSQGVASAVASVMGGNNNQNITIELDGEVLYRSNQRVEKRLGYNLGI